MASAVHVDIPLPEAQRMADMFGIQGDLLICLDCCKGYLARLQRQFQGEEDARLTTECLVTTAFTKYGRCFKGGVRKGVEKELLSSLNDEDLEVHELIINIRDKHVSHSVNSFETPQVCVWLRGGDDDRQVTNVNVSIHGVMGPDADIFVNWMILLEKQLEWLRTESQKESKRLKTIVEKRYSLDELYDRIGKGSAPTIRIGDIPKTRKRWAKHAPNKARHSSPDRPESK